MVRIGSTVYSSFIWESYEKSMIFILCDVIGLVKLQGKFEIDHVLGVKGLMAQK